MSDAHAPIRSYQRIFRPDRRIYQLDGRRLPVPGGVPLRWLGHAGAMLVAVIALSGGAGFAYLLFVATAGLAGLLWAGRRAALLVGAASLVVLPLVGFVLRGLDWPLRLVVLPALAATVLAQATPDGRPALRYFGSLVALWLSPSRRSLDRTLPALDEPVSVGGRLRAAPDEHSRELRRARVNGPAQVEFAAAMVVRRGRVRRRRLVARTRPRPWSRGWPVTLVELAEGERVEVRP